MSVSAYPFWDGEDRKGMPSIYLGHKGFVDAGHEVLFVKPGPVTREYDLDGIRMHEFRFPTSPLTGRFQWLHRLTLKIYWVAFVLWGGVVVLRLASRFRPHVVYGQFFHGAPLAWLVGRVHHIPNITRMYGTFLARVIDSPRKWLWYEEVLAFKIPCTCMIMTNDGTRGDDVARALGMPQSRLKFWRNGVRKSMFDPTVDRAAFKASLGVPASHATILMLCRLERWKGVDRLIAALPAIVARQPEITAVIVGEGEEREALEAQAQALGVSAHVRFVGAVYHEEIAWYLNAADLFVSLYHHSNVGNPLLEALCCGKCIVTLNNGATGKLIAHQHTGWLVEEDDLAALPDVIGRLLADRDLRDRLAGAARRYAEAELDEWPARIRREITMVEEMVAQWARERSGNV
jgi:glycosyltransferase involved in cell wall biosynthesis